MTPQPSEIIGYTILGILYAALLFGAGCGILLLFGVWVNA